MIRLSRCGASRAASARSWGLLVASALGGSSLNVPLWGLIALGAVGLALFVLGMKYGDRMERWVLRRLVHHREE